MKQIRFTLLLPLCLIFACSVQAQTLKELTQLDNSYQTCLDKGTDMLGCSQLYYTQMDSLLNAAYNKLRKPLDPAGKAALKSEQMKWLGKRDAYFKKIDREYAAENSNGFAGTDSRMIALHEKAQFVRKRVAELLAKQGKG